MPARRAATAFSLSPPIGSTVAAQRDLAGHRDVGARRDAGERADQRRRHGDAGRRAVLGHRALGHVHVDVDVAVEPLVEPELRGARARVRQRRLPRLAHHVAELAGEQQLALAGQDADLDREQVAAGLGPGQAVRDADPRRALDRGVEEARRARATCGRFSRRHRHAALERARRPCARDLAAQPGDLALEVAHAGLARVAVDERAQRRRRRSRRSSASRPAAATCLGTRKRLAICDLLGLEVAGQPDDLHAVGERRRDRCRASSRCR